MAPQQMDGIVHDIKEHSWHQLRIREPRLLVEGTSDSVQNLKELLQMVPHGVSFLAAPDRR